MRLLLAFLLLFAPLSAGAFSYATGGCASGGGCAAGEQWEYTNANEIDTALDSLESTTSSHASTISALASTYLALAGGTMAGTLEMGSNGITFGSGGFITVGSGASISPFGSATISATRMSATGQIDDNDLASGAVDLDGAEVAGTLPVTNGGTGATALTNLITLSTHTTGNYVATIADSGASEVTVTNGATEGGAVTLAIASTITRDSELANISAASSTDNAIARFDSTAGDVQNSGVTIDDSNNVVTPGSLSAGGSSGASTIVLRNTADSGWVECGVVSTTWTCAVDADGTPDGTL